MKQRNHLMLAFWAQITICLLWCNLLKFNQKRLFSAQTESTKPVQFGNGLQEVNPSAHHKEEEECPRFLSPVSADLCTIEREWPKNRGSQRWLTC